MGRGIRFRTLAASACASLLAAGSAGAATITLGLDIEFSGATAPVGPTPWVTVHLDDSFGGPNTVRLTLATPNLTGTERVKNLLLNFDLLLDPTLLVFGVVDNSAAQPVIGTGVDAFKADGDGFFDIEFDFSAGTGEFNGGESVIYDLSYLAPIDISSFLFLSEMGGGAGAFLAAAQIQSIGPNGESGWVGHVPEPGSAWLLGLGLGAIAATRRRAARS